MWIILIFVLIGLVLPIVATLVDGYLRGKRADVLRVAVEQKLVNIADLKTMLFEERRGDPLGNFKAGLILLAVGSIFLLWGFGEFVALKMNPQLMKLPGLRVGIVQPQSANPITLKDQGINIDPKYDSERIRLKNPNKFDQKAKEIEDNEIYLLNDTLEKNKDKQRPDETKDEFRKRILDKVRERQNELRDELKPEKRYRDDLINPRGTEAEKLNQIFGQRRVAGNKKRMVIVETPGLPLIATTKVFIGTLLLTIALILLLIHQKYSKL